MSNKLKQTYDVVIIGGGPSALIELYGVLQLGYKPLVISQEYGGNMGMMGNICLQSYTSELVVEASPLKLSSYMKGKNNPTGAEYHRYIKDSFDAAKAAKINGKVTAIYKSNTIFSIEYEFENKIHTVNSKNVILATGIRPQSADVNFSNIYSCFDIYKKSQNNKLEDISGRDVYILGSGNSAYQIVTILASVARSVTLLTNGYKGFYPMETNNRFALRAPSAQAMELINKNIINDIDEANNNYFAQMKILNHDSFTFSPQNNEFMIRLSKKKNLKFPFEKSFNNLSNISHINDDYFIYRAPAKNAVVISAKGVCANDINYQGNSLIDDNTGYLSNVDGRTSINGLYVAGSAGGLRSVNEILDLVCNNIHKTPLVSGEF